MLLFEEERIAIMLPPRTGTTSLQTAASTRAIRIWGQHPCNDRSIERHCCMLPRYIRSNSKWQILITTRNPTHRMMSLWSHYHWWCDQYGKTVSPFETFVFESFSGLTMSFHSLPVGYWFQMAEIQGHKAKPVRLECMEEDLRHAGLEISVPHLNSSEREEGVTVTDDLLRLINLWGVNDNWRPD